MDILTNRQNSCRLFRNVNKSLLRKYVQLKTEFQRFSPPNYQILSTFRVWKQRFTSVVQVELSKIRAEVSLEDEVTQQQAISMMIDRHKGCQQFNQLLRNLNSSIETIKDFIRTVSIKDPATQIYIS